MARLIRSLAFKIGVAVVGAEILILSLIGVYYVDYFSAEIDRRAEERLQTPGKLMQRGLLKYAAVADRAIMADLVGSELEEAMVIGVNRNIFHSLNTDLLGRRVTDLPGMKAEWFGPDRVAPQLIRSGNDVIGITPFFTLDSSRPFLFAFIKASTHQAAARKAEVVRLVLYGSLLTVVATSAIIIFALQRSVLGRLGRALQFVTQVRGGNLSARLAIRGKDELARLEGGLNDMVSDIDHRTHEREEAQEALRRSEARFRDFTASSSDWYWETDNSLAYQFVSYRFFELIEEVYGSPLRRRLDALGMEAVSPEGWAGLVARMEAREPFQGFLFCWLDAKDHPHYGKISGIPVFDASETFLGYRGTGSDVTESHLAAEEQARLERQLARARRMEAIGAMAGGVAHEFNNCLAGILNFAELVRRGANDRQKVGEYIDQVIKLGERASGVADQLLLLSRKQIAQPRAVRVDTALLEMEKLLHTMLEHRVELQMWTADGPLFAKIDPNQLSASIVNLAINARDAMPDGGNLQISAQRQALDARRLAAHKGCSPGDYVVITVQDTGTGMDQSTLEHIFEPFFSTKEPGKGTGLGLSIVYAWVEQSGGFLDVDSAPGSGSTFSIHLPLVAAPAEAVAGGDPHTPQRGGGETVLVVDDEESIRQVVGLVLEDAGYRVVAAADGAGARARMQSREVPIDLLLTDVVMPGVTGPQLAAELKASWPQMKVLFMSGYPARIRKQIEAFPGRAGFLKKPFTPDALLAQVRQVLDTDAARDDPAAPKAVGVAD